ncbi:MAG: FAD-binding oxidoreductase [Anaerolineae bacterium]|nr:FAD-binding oxidoreductase [Anaerolineae bacterium]MDX9831930.1 FAD-binding oxidoreductase [Anaerolineae bacterium]
MSRIFVPDAAEMPRTADAVVVGGGIVGVATAFWLSRAGLDTVLVEMRDGLSTLTTPNSIECFRAQFTEPAMAELALPSIAIFENLAEVIGIPGYDVSLRHQGYLFVTDDPATVPDMKASVEQHRRVGVTDSEFLDHDELLRRFPYLSDRAVAATFRQNDGWLSSHEATQGFAKGSSARFLLQTRATGIGLDGQGVCGVETNRGTISTRTVVNAAGPFAGVVCRMAGVELPLEPVRRQKAFISPRPQIPQDAPLTIDVIQDVYWRPETGGAYIAWVDPDEPAGDPREDLPLDWDYPAVVLDKLVRLNPFWDEIAATLKGEEIHPSAGQYVYTPDDQPLIGPVPEVAGFYVNCGYWAGVMLSPEAGRRIARLVTGEMKPEENALRPTRYAEGIVYEGGSFLRGRH